MVKVGFEPRTSPNTEEQQSDLSTCRHYLNRPAYLNLPVLFLL